MPAPKLLHLLKDGSGNVMLLAALAMTGLIGGAGLATDTIQWTLWKRQLQREADSAALAAALVNYQGGSAAATATTEIARNNLIALTANPIVEVGPTAGPYAGNQYAVRVVLQAGTSLPFSSLFTGGATTVTAQATAAAISYGTYCVQALDPTATTSITFQGSATLTMGCGIEANAQGSTAISAGGSSYISGSPIAAVGGIPSSNNYAPNTTLLPYIIPQADPFAGLPTPSPSGCSGQVTVQPNNTAAIANPTGVTCLRGLDIKGTANFAPGIYFIDSGQFSAGSQAVLNGSGVTFILTSSNAATNPSQVSTLNINGGATLNLTAPASGDYAGVLFYQDRRASQGTTDFLNGNSSSILQGAVYFPSQTLNFTGTTGMNTNCLQLVARDLVFSGNSTITNSCPTNSGTSAITGVQVKLVN
ncbi:MAG TPA: pilus assembly protein TadG-related protein [Novosphingobium sp.]